MGGFINSLAPEQFLRVSVQRNSVFDNNVMSKLTDTTSIRVLIKTQQTSHICPTNSNLLLGYELSWHVTLICGIFPFQRQSNNYTCLHCMYFCGHILKGKQEVLKVKIRTLANYYMG